MDVLGWTAVSGANGPLRNEVSANPRNSSPLHDAPRDKGDAEEISAVEEREDLIDGVAAARGHLPRPSCGGETEPPPDELAILSESQQLARIGSWQQSPTGAVWWSEEMYRIFEVSRKAFIPSLESVLALVHPEDRRAVQASSDALAPGRKCNEVEFRTIRSDGSIRWISSRAVLKARRRGDPLYVIGTCQDITDRKGMEENLAAALEYSRLLVDVTPVGVIVCKATGECISANDAQAKIVGTTVEQLEKQNFRTLESWQRSGLLVMAERALAENKIYQRDIHIDPSTFGRASWLSARLVPFYFNSKQFLLGIFADITQRKIIEQQNEVHLAKLETALLQTVEVINALSAMRDPYTAGHERRVAEIAVAIGAELGFDAQRQQGLRVAGHLHDVGKINVPAEILSKPGRLSPAEFALVKEHPQAGYDVLKNVSFPWPVAQVALQHHERIDGSGYPRGLKGDEITLEARIVAVADVVESMASHRPYRPALGFERALAEIERGRGTAFDADVVGACLRLFREGHYRLPA